MLAKINTCIQSQYYRHFDYRNPFIQCYILTLPTASTEFEHEEEVTRDIETIIQEHDVINTKQTNFSLNALQEYNNFCHTLI